VMKLVDDREVRQQMLADFDEVIAKLGKGSAKEVAARAILKEINRDEHRRGKNLTAP